MYKTYRAAAGNSVFERDDSVEKIIQQINDARETIVSVTAVGTDNFWVVIITQTRRMPNYRSA